jgi:hypothetical protein
LLLSAGAIATSFLSGQALRTEANAWAWTAIAFFVVFGAVALRILWPRAEGAEGFTAVPSDMIAEYLEGETRHSLPKIYRELALPAEAAHDLNRDRHFAPLTWYFRAAISLLMAEIVMWVVALVSRKDVSRWPSRNPRRQVRCARFRAMMPRCARRAESLKSGGSV